MLSSTARLATERPHRYLVQLCRHVDQIARMNPAMDARVEWTESEGVISIGPACCLLRADTDALVLRVEADDEGGLTRLTQTVGSRLEQFGRREHVTVTWSAARNDASERDASERIEP